MEGETTILSLSSGQYKCRAYVYGLGSKSAKEKVSVTHPLEHSIEN